MDESFRHFDTDGNGYITGEELEEGLAQLGRSTFSSNYWWRFLLLSLLIQSFLFIYFLLIISRRDPHYQDRQHLHLRSSLLFLFLLLLFLVFYAYHPLHSISDLSFLFLLFLFSGIFDNVNIKNWRSQIPSIIRKFDKSGDGTVSLREFFLFLGVDNYAPNIIQKMTKIFALATEKGLTFQDIFAELDDDKNGKLDGPELKRGLVKLGTFGEISDRDAMEVVKQFDHNGDSTISLEEFITFFSSRVQSAAEDRKIKKTKKLVRTFCEIMLKVKDKGVETDSLFNHFDKDKGGTISVLELQQSLRSLPQFKILSDPEINSLISEIDADRSGEISLTEFKNFIVTNTPPTIGSGNASGSESANISGKNDKNNKNDNNDRNDENDEKDETYSRNQGSRSGVSTDKAARTSKEIFSEQMRRISKSDGGVEGLLAFLDEDGDGIISLKSLMRVFDRERVFDHIDEDKVEGILESMMRGGDRGSGGGVSVVALIQYLQNKDNDDDQSYRSNNKNRRDGEGKDNDSDDDNDNDNNNKNSKNGKNNKDDELQMVPVEYDFSPDPETRSLEKKLRGLGRALCKKGVDVEGLFRALDLRQTGMVRRTEFVEILSKIGLSILEKGKALEEAERMIGQESGSGAGPGSESRRLQVLIYCMNILKGCLCVTVKF